jgi:methylmalonyl-CoA epimerase
VEDQGVEEVLFPAGTSFIQLLGSLGPETPIGRHLAKRGPGVHHIAYRVEDVAAAIDHLRREGAEMIDEVPRSGSRGTSIAFVRPGSMGGVLVELVEEG